MHWSSWPYHIHLHTPLTHLMPMCRYVAKGMDKAGTKLKVVVRGKVNDAEVVKLPFVPTQYFKG